MVVKLGLNMGYDFGVDGGTVNLLDYTDGFDVAYQGWNPNTTPDRDGLITEMINVRARGTSVDDLATKLQSLAAAAWEVQRFSESAVGTVGVWLRVQLNGESKERQSWVHEIRHKMESSVYDVTFDTKYHANEYQIAIRRNPWWEATSPGAIVFGGSSLGGTAAYLGIGGNFPARLGNIQLITKGSDSHPPMRDIWIGFRSNRYGYAGTLFAPWWPIGTIPAVGLGTAIADTFARSGTAWQGTTANTDQIFFGGQTVLYGATPKEAAAQRGQHMILMRARIAGGTATMQLQTAWKSDGAISGTASTWGNAQTYSRVYLESSAGTAFKFYEMGVVDIPLSRAHAYMDLDLMAYQMLILRSQTIAGTPTIGVDGFYLVPHDEGYVRLKYSGNSPAGTAELSAEVWINELPNGEKTSVFKSTGGPFAVSSLTMTGGVPPGDGMIILCGQSLTESLPTYSFPGGYVRYFERWRELRGNDGI